MPCWTSSPWTAVSQDDRIGQAGRKGCWIVYFAINILEKNGLSGKQFTMK